MEYEQNRAIREAREAREVEQQQQETLAQFCMFRECLANQEEAGRLLNDSSYDTWQDVISPPNSVIWDSGLQLAMRRSNDSTSTE